MSEKAKRSGRRTLATKRENLLAGLWGSELEELKIWRKPTCRIVGE